MSVDTIFNKQNREIAILLEKAERADVQEDSNTLLVRCRVPFTGPGSPPSPLYYRVKRKLSGFGVVIDVRQLVLSSGQLVPDENCPVLPLYINVVLDVNGPIVNAWHEAVQRTRDADEMKLATMRAGSLRGLRLLGIIVDELPA